jgi:hypothetical protein
MVEELFEHWLIGGQPIASVALTVHRRCEAVNKSVRRLYQLSNESDDILEKEYFHRFDIPFDKRPHVYFYGGGWMHFIDHFVKALDWLCESLDQLRESRGDDFPDRLHPLVTALWFEAIRTNRHVVPMEKPMFMHLGVRAELGVLKSMMWFLNSYDRVLREQEMPRHITDYLNMRVPGNSASTTRLALAGEDDFAQDWFATMYSPDPTLQKLSRETFLETCSRLGVDVPSDWWDTYFKLWPLRAEILDIVTLGQVS